LRKSGRNKNQFKYNVESRYFERRAALFMEKIAQIYADYTDWLYLIKRFGGLK